MPKSNCQHSVVRFYHSFRRVCFQKSQSRSIMESKFISLVSRFIVKQDGINKKNCLKSPPKNNFQDLVEESSRSKTTTLVTYIPSSRQIWQQQQQGCLINPSTISPLNGFPQVGQIQQQSLAIAKRNTIKRNVPAKQPRVMAKSTQPIFRQAPCLLVDN